MSVFDTTGAESCRRCGENARAEVERLQAENAKLRVELTDLRLKSCPSCGIKVENEKLRDQLEEQKCFAADLERDVRALRELVQDMWNDMCVCHDQHVHPSSRDLRFHADNMRELGIEVEP